MLRFLQAGGPVHWEVAAQVARWVAESGSDPSGLSGLPGIPGLPGMGGMGGPTPAEAGPAVSSEDRQRLAEVASAAEALVLADTGQSLPVPSLEALGRAEWADRALTQLRPVLERLAITLQGEAAMPDPASTEMNPLAGMMGALGPLLLGVQCGFMVGQLAQGLLSQHDFLLPAPDPAPPAVIVPNLEEFHEAWSIPPDDLRYYVALSESVRSRMCSRPWVRARLVALASEYVGSFRVDPEAIQAQLGTMDITDPSSLEGLLGDPDAMLGAMTSPAQQAVLERLQLTTAVLESYADAVVDRLAGPMVPSLGVIREARRRHRLERSEADRFVQRLLGLDPSGRTHAAAAAFCAGVIERAGTEGLDQLLTGEDFLPTPAELEAPGLWLARLELGR
ncbi:MAG: zinc-dependent metalloprotease [Acidimicrobiia bacterium]